MTTGGRLAVGLVILNTEAGSSLRMLGCFSC